MSEDVVDVKMAIEVWTARLERHRISSFLLDCFATLMRIEGRDRVLMLAGQAFIALVPMLVVIASLTHVSSAPSVGAGIVEKLELTDSAAAAVLALFAYPPGATGGVTLLSVGLLVFSINGFARSVQRTFEGAWCLPRMGVRGTLSRGAGLVALLVTGFSAGWVGGQVGATPLGFFLALLVQCGVIACVDADRIRSG